MTMSHSHRKQFGQHFLHDLRVLNDIKNYIAPQPDDCMVEIGPGEGVLTELLLPFVKRLDIIEIDNDLINPLRQRFANQPQLHIHHRDVLKFDFNSLVTQPQKLRIVGNLPYNISTPLLFKLFADNEFILDMTFLLQLEVAERLAATVGNTNYNRLSVMAQYYCQNDLLFIVEPSAFKPPPKVQSALIRLKPRQLVNNAHDMAHFSEIVRIAFNHRRKTIANNLKNLLSTEKLTSLNINPQLRPQNLAVDDYVRISNHIRNSKDSK